MKDRSLKYSKAYVKTRIDALNRDFVAQMQTLKQNHDRALESWKNHPHLTSALESAYYEELEQLRNSFNQKVAEVQNELDSLAVADTHHRKPARLESGIQKLIKKIRGTSLIFLSITLLRTENLLK
ncbi:MAG TPA: hypothetical protein VIH22_12390 [Cyclobacteriaceae bacterium]